MSCECHCNCTYHAMFVSIIAGFLAPLAGRWGNLIPFGPVSYLELTRLGIPAFAEIHSSWSSFHLPWSVCDCNCCFGCSLIAAESCSITRLCRCKFTIFAHLQFESRAAIRCVCRSMLRHAQMCRCCSCALMADTWLLWHHMRTVTSLDDRELIA